VTLRPVNVEPTPDVFAAAMATGIVSIAARNHHYVELSDVLGVLASLGLAALVAVVAGPRAGGVVGSIYALMTWLILWRAIVDRRDRDGFAPDSWIMMGGLAIATLAGDVLHQQLSGWPAQRCGRSPSSPGWWLRCGLRLRHALVRRRG